MYLKKRIYDMPDISDGTRVLVDRLWPRGVSKERAKLDSWEKQIAPGKEIRKEFHRGLIDFREFEGKYERELSVNPDFPVFLDKMAEYSRKGNVTLLTASLPSPNHVDVLLRYLK